MEKQLFTQAQVDEAVREAKLVVLRGLPGKAPYVRPDGMMTTVDEIRTELLTTQSKSKEAEKHDATQRPNTLDT